MLVKWPLSRVKILGTIAILKNFIYCLGSRGNKAICIVLRNLGYAFLRVGYFRLFIFFAPLSG